MSTTIAMTIDEARTLLARHSGSDRESFGLEAITEHFYDASPEERARVWASFIALALEGNELEVSLASRFLFNQAAPASMVRPLVAAVLSGTHPRQRALESILGAWPAALEDDARSALMRLFVADPITHFALAGNLVRADPRGSAWSAYASALDRIEDLGTLIGGFEAATLAAREDDYFAILARRPPELLRTLAPLLPSGAGERLAKAAGLE